MDREAGLQHLAKLTFGEPKLSWERLILMINEWPKFEEEINTCDFSPKNVCYSPQN